MALIVQDLCGEGKLAVVEHMHAQWRISARCLRLEHVRFSRAIQAGEW